MTRTNWIVIGAVVIMALCALMTPTIMNSGWSVVPSIDKTGVMVGIMAIGTLPYICVVMQRNPKTKAKTKAKAKTFGDVILFAWTIAGLVGAGWMIIEDVFLVGSIDPAHPPPAPWRLYVGAISLGFAFYLITKLIELWPSSPATEAK